MNFRKGFTLLELLVVIVIIGILVAVFSPKIAENNRNAKAKADSAEVIDSVASENVVRMNVALEVEQQSVDRIRKAFLSSTPEIDGKKQEDLICNNYSKLIKMGSALEEEDRMFESAGISKENALKMYADSATVFTDKIGKIIAMSESDRKKLEASWSHTCDGMLHPTDLRQMIGAYTGMLSASKAPKPVISPAMRAILLKYYRADVVGLGGEAGDLGVPGDGYEGLYWFKKEELLPKK